MIPLAEKLRPKKFSDVLGQEHLTGEQGVVRKMVESGTLNSVIFWGLPGTGKTTLAEIISEQSGRKFFKLSDVSSGVKEVREVIEQAKKQNLLSGKSPNFFGGYSVWRKRPIRLSMLDFGFLVWYGIYSL